MDDQVGVPALATTLYQPNVGMVTVVTGNTDNGSKKPLATHNPFQIGSITKTFVAATILQLEAQGKLSITDKMSQWFPQYPRWKVYNDSAIAEYEQWYLPI